MTDLPPPVQLSEREAITTLRVIAAMNGGEVWELAEWGDGDWAPPLQRIGFVVGDAADLRSRWPTGERWIWLREDCLMAWRALPDDAIGRIFPLGRIDRGLGAIP